MPVQPLEEIEVYVLAEEIADKWWEIVSQLVAETVFNEMIKDLHPN